MKILKSIVLAIIVGFAFCVNAQNNTLAVLNFDNNSFIQAEQYQPLSKGLAEMMITEFSRIQAIRVVERRELNSILDEMKLSQTGSIAENASVQVGKMLGAQHLVFGGYTVALDKKIRIDTRIIEVETGLTLKAEEVTGKVDKILSLVKKLSKKILKDLDIKITKDEEKVLAKSDKIDLSALIAFSEGLDFEDQGEVDKAIECYNKALDIEPNFERADDRIRALSKKGEDIN